MNAQYPFSRPDGLSESASQKQLLTQQVLDAELQELIQVLEET